MMDFSPDQLIVSFGTHLFFSFFIGTNKEATIFWKKKEMFNMEKLLNITKFLFLRRES